MSGQAITIEEAIEVQRQACAALSAPCTTRVILSEFAVVRTRTETARKMRDWPALTKHEALPLRLAGGLHNLFLTGDAPELARVYNGELSDQETIDAIVCALIERFDVRLASWLDSPPQTNEAGRSACIMAGLLWLARRLGSRFELNEIGASAGINTMMDRYYFKLGGIRVGPVDSPMRIVPEWRGLPPPRSGIAISAIRGSDIAPLDLSDRDEALRLKSYCWPDVPDRMQRIDAAIALAAQRSPDLIRADAGDWVPKMLARKQQPGVTRVLYHSIMWQYMPSATRDRVAQTMQEAGTRATPDRPLAWVKFEQDDPLNLPELAVCYWDGTQQHSHSDWITLAKAHPHGAFIEWLGA